MRSPSTRTHAVSRINCAAVSVDRGHVASHSRVRVRDTAARVGGWSRCSVGPQTPSHSPTTNERQETQPSGACSGPNERRPERGCGQSRAPCAATSSELGRTNAPHSALLRSKTLHGGRCATMTQTDSPSSVMNQNRTTIVNRVTRRRAVGRLRRADGRRSTVRPIRKRPPSAPSRPAPASTPTRTAAASSRPPNASTATRRTSTAAGQRGLRSHETPGSVGLTRDSRAVSRLGVSRRAMLPAEQAAGALEPLRGWAPAVTGQRMIPVWPSENRPGWGQTQSPWGPRPTGIRARSLPVRVLIAYTSAL